MNTPSELHIEHPERWRLEVAVRQQQVQYIAYAPDLRDTLTIGTVPLDPGREWLAAVENAVYDHPAMLDDFGAVRVVVEAQHFVVAPATVAHDEMLASRTFDAMFPDDDLAVNCCSLPKCGVTIVYGLPRGLREFLQRTFNNPLIVHHLYPLCEHFHDLNAGATASRLFINTHERSMDIALFQNERLVLANTLPWRNAEEAAYLVLHTCETMRLDALTDEVQLTGDKQQRDALAPLLRKFVKYVMPAIFPAAALRLGSAAMKAPLDLILIASCES